MANVIISPELSFEEKIAQMRMDARFDVADDPFAREGETPDLSRLVGDVRSARALPQVPKVFLSNACSFNCAYCGCRSSNDETRRYCHDPRELARMAVAEAVRGGRGIFLTSAIFRNADYTQELIIRSLNTMRGELDFRGYIHAKVMPGADPALIKEAGRLANRLSVNIEVAKSAGYERVAKQKNRENILTPMAQISRMIAEAKRERGVFGPRFATTQTTQLMAGSTGEDDRTIMTLSSALYRKYGLRRVYYTSFQYRHPAAGYDLPPTQTPAWRTTRLYQADRLLALYQFTPDEITPDSQPFLEKDIDPKAAWAIRHLDRFPVEVNTADREMLLRVPGIGLVAAEKIIRARRVTRVTHDVLAQLGISRKRCVLFVTCCGKYAGGQVLERDTLRSMLADRRPFVEQPKLWDAAICGGF